MKESTKTILLFLALILTLIFAPSCTKQPIHQDLCINGDCESQFIVVYKNQEIFPNINGEYEIKWDGLDYFQIKGQTSELNSEYCNADGIPFITTKFDSFPSTQLSGEILDLAADKAVRLAKDPP